MAVKLSSVRTKTITSTTADGLDGNVRDYCQTLTEEQVLEIRFAAAPGFFAAFIAYTV